MNYQKYFYLKIKKIKEIFNKINIFINQNNINLLTTKINTASKLEIIFILANLINLYNYNAKYLNPISVIYNDINISFNIYNHRNNNKKCTNI